MKEIIWTSPKYGQFKILVDDEDYEEFNGHVCVGYRPATRTRKVCLQVKTTRRPQEIFARSLIKCPSGKVVDHIDRNPLNNQKSNLRICTPRENSRNREYSSGKNPYKGVFSNNQKEKPWSTRVTLHLGSFRTAEEAARVYDEAIRKLHGDFAVTNFPLEESP